MTTTATATPSNQRLAFDTLIRRELKVGDPTDPGAVARALMDRYQNDNRARAIDGEAKGLPFLNTPIARTPDMAVPSAIDLDLEQARTRVNANLTALLTDSLTQTMRPELEGWQNAIGHALDEGISNARIGIDPARRDVAFAMRRQLLEYARLCRLVSLFSPALRSTYRSLALSLDDAAIVILVMIGESMANLGLSGGRFLLQTSYAELQSRRDAVLAALRRIDGLAAQGSDGASHWPRGLRAHRQMSLLLEARGQGDLRSLMNEPELARTMDELVQLASGGTPRGLRSIGSTAWSPLNRMRRFVRTAGGLVDPSSHELAGLLESMQLFVEGFEPAGGFRLLRIARPALLGQFAGSTMDLQPAEARLLQLTQARTALATRIEAWQACRCDVDTLRQQAALDRVLFEVDSAIDAYADGSTELGLCEVRASSSHVLVRALTDDSLTVQGVNHLIWVAPTPLWVAQLRLADPPLMFALRTVTDLLRPAAGGGAPLWSAGYTAAYELAFDDNLAIDGEGAPQPRFGQVLHDEIANNLDMDQGWLPVIRQLATESVHIPSVLGANDGIVHWQRRALDTIERVSGVPAAITLPSIEVPQHFEVSLQQLATP